MMEKHNNEYKDHKKSNSKTDQMESYSREKNQHSPQWLESRTDWYAVQFTGAVL